MKNRILNKILLFSFVLVMACSCPSSDQLSVTELDERFTEISAIEDPEIRKAEVDSLWNRLKSQDQIPFVQDTIAIFLYRGEAESVSWNGDFNSWSGDKSYLNAGTRIEGTDIWMLKTSFPKNARVDYKVTIDGDWILDPVNPIVQWSGFGPNSELQMPKWKPEPLEERIPEAPKGNLSEYKLIESSNLEYDVQYQLYIPVGYENLEKLPVLYVLDGQEYSDDRLGKTIIMLDNLIHLKKIEPVVAVFIDPRNPENPDENRRMQEFGTDENYNAFFINELMPEIEANYKVSEKRDETALLGTSLGGLNTTYLGFKNPEVFGNLAIQAPAYWYREKEIYGLVQNTESADFNIFMSAGTINDNLLDTRRMKKEFDRLDLDMKYVEVNEGHSWGAWSAQMDDILIQFFGK